MRGGWANKRLDAVGSAIRQQASIAAAQEYELWSVPSFELGAPEHLLGSEIGSAKLRVQPNDVLICKINPRINRVWLVSAPTDGREQICSPEWVVFRANHEAGLYPRWLLHFVSAPRFREWIVSEVSGATGSHSRANADGIMRQEMPMPSLADQKRIVAILDEAFEGIATAKANAERNVNNARAVFDSHLQYIVARRGNGWQLKTLEEVALTFGRGKSRHRPRNATELYGGSYPFVQTGDIRNADHFITEYSQTYSDVGLAQSKLWPKGTVCITIAANIAETAVLGFDACFPDSVIGLVANPNAADVGFIEYLLQSYKVSIQAMGKGSAQANINLGTFENERFPFPPLVEQTKIVAALDTLREDIQHLASNYELKVAALEALKKSLLHKAFTGNL